MLTVISTVITVQEKGFAVDGQVPATCTLAIVGEDVQIMLKLQVQSNVKADLNVNWSGPDGGDGAIYYDVNVDAGSKNYLFTTFTTYNEGVYTIGNINISNVRPR